jgi:hypothetical protein
VVSHQGWGVPKPPPSITLSTEEGEILIDRVEGSGAGDPLIFFG